MVDTHTHLNLKPLSDDVGTYLDRAREQGVEQMIIVGTDLSTSQAALKLAEQHPELLSSVGIHPEAASPPPNAPAGGQVSNFKQLEKLLPNPKIKAIGECGLDYKGTVDHSAQKELFDLHIALANQTQLPLIIHCRDAYEDLITLLEHTAQTPRFVLHCVSGPLDYIERALALGAYVSFAGNVTYPSAHAIREIAKITPLDRLLVETDAPFLAPQVYRGQTNEPAYVVETARYLADFLGVDFTEFDHLTTKNAREFFQF